MHFTNYKYRYSSRNRNSHLKTTSIMLWLARQYCFCYQMTFNVHNLSATIKHIEHAYNIKKQPMPTNTEEVLDGIATQKMAVRRLLNFDLTIRNVYKFAKATAKLIEKLPRVSLFEEYNEMKLCSCFVDPFLSELFDEPDQDIFLRWTNEATLEAKKKKKTSKAH